MKIRTIEGIVGLAALAITISSLATPLYADTSSPLQTLSLVGQPWMQYSSSEASLIATYQNQSPTQVNATVYAVVSDSIGQTVYVGMAPIVVNPGQSRNASFAFPLQPNPYAVPYTVDLFVVSSWGVGISLNANSTIIA